MRLALAALLAVLAGAASAQETVRSTISGDITIKFEQQAPAEAGATTEEQKKLRACEQVWLRRLAENRKGREQAEMDRAKPPGARAAVPVLLTRADYRACIYKCLQDPASEAC